MTPPLGTKAIDDSDPRLPAQPDPGNDYVTRDCMKMRLLQHENECHERGAVHDIRQTVDKMRMQQAAAGGVLALLTVLGPVVLAWWLSTRLPAQQHRTSEAPSLVNQAHAETKGAP